MCPYHFVDLPHLYHKPASDGSVLWVYQVFTPAGLPFSPSQYAWKYFLQHRLANAHNLKITLAHYPTGTSKWNPIEHRLFSEVSKNWAGVPLESYEVILNCLNTTSTSTGLTVRASLVKREYEKGIKIEKSQMELLNIEKDTEFPNWNYTIRPQAEEIIARLCET